MQETWDRSLGWENLLEKRKATHSSTLAWRIPWTGEVHGVAKSWTRLSNFHFASRTLQGPVGCRDLRRLSGHRMIFFFIFSENYSVVLTLCKRMDCIVYGLFQARILEWVAFSFSRGFSQPRDRTQVSRVAGGFFTSWANREAQGVVSIYAILVWGWIQWDMNLSRTLLLVTKSSCLH